MVENDDGVLELIDGLQRVSSVIQFIAPEAIKKDPLRLVGCDLVKELNGNLFVDLPLSDRLRIKRTPIRAIIIKKQGNPYIKYELFKRLNTGGSLLSAQEIRNCSSRMIEGGEDFYKHIQSLANYEPFKIAIGRLPDNSLSEKGDEELVLFSPSRILCPVITVTYRSGSILTWRVFSSGHHHLTSKGSETYLNNHFRSSPTNLAKTPSLAIETGSLWDDWHLLYEAVIGGLLPNNDSVRRKSAETLKRGLAAVFESEDFRRVTGPGANTIEKLNERIHIVSEFFGK